MISKTRDGAQMPIGLTYQAVQRVTEQGRTRLKVTVHQSVNGGTFDMRDTFILDSATLRPIRFENDRNGHRHVTLHYSPDRVTGSRMDKGVSEPIEADLTGPVWEGNLYGLTVAALPLTAGASFTVPYFQYDKGLGNFAIRVSGEETVTTPGGQVQA